MNTDESNEYKNPLMSNDFDIVEHFSDEDDDGSSDDVELPKFDSSGFPKPKHRNDSEYVLSKPKEYDEYIFKPIEQMSVEEIKEAQNYLYKKLGKEMCEFIKERKLKRMNESNSFNGNDNNEKLDATQLESQNELIFKFDKREFLKYEWMNSSEMVQNEQPNQESTANDDLKLHEVRFHFEGFQMTGSEDMTSYQSSLYNHGLDPNKPGYTWPELVHLLQSSFKPQVQIAIKAISNILFNYYSPNENVSDTDVRERTEKMYFRYRAYRWNKYINTDLELMTKLGYLMCENQMSTIILIDSLRCLSLLTFGDGSRWNNFESPEDYFVLPVRDVLFDYYEFYSGLDIYYWNSLHLDLTETNVYDCDNGEGQLEDSKSLVTSNGKSGAYTNMALKLNKEFYSKVLNGVYQEGTNGEVLRDLFINIDVTDSENVELESKLYLLTRHNILYKLLLIMKRYRDNIKVQIYSTSVICGYIISFGTQLANSIIECKLFKEHFEFILNLLATQSGKHYVHLNGVVLRLLMLLSVYLDYIPEYFTSFISLIKETITRSFGKQLKNLNMIDHYSEEDEQYESYASTSIKCMTIWAIKGYLLDSLDEFVPLFNLSTYTIGNWLSRNNGQKRGTDGNSNKVDGTTDRDASVGIDLDNEHYHLLASINLHFATCLRINNMSSHFKFNGVMDKVDELIEKYGNYRSLKHQKWYYLYSLLQLKYDYIYAKCSSDDYEDLGSSPTFLLKILDNVLEVYSFDFPEDLIELTWFDDNTFTGSKCCLHREDIIREKFNGYILPFNVVNLILNILIKLETVDKIYRIGRREDGSEIEGRKEVKDLEKSKEDDDGVKWFMALEGLDGMKKRLFKLGDDLSEILRKVYIKLHRLKPFYLNNTVYLVKSLPIFESCLVYLRSLVHFGYDPFNAVIPTLALSVDYTKMEDSLNLVYCDEGVPMDDHKEVDNTGVYSSLNEFKHFNKYIGSYSLGSDKLPLVSFLSYATYLPLTFNKSYEVEVVHILLKNYGNKLLAWIESEFLFGQLVSTINNSSEDLVMHLSVERYGIFQTLLFTKLSIPLKIQVNSEHVVDRWIECIRKLKGVDGHDNAGRDGLDAESKLVSYFDSAEAMETSCGKLIAKFNSGQCDSPVTVGLIMLFISHWSTEECSNLIWSDESLMLLLGRNLALDVGTWEVKSTLLDGYTFGTIRTFTFSPESIVKSQNKILESFTDESVHRGDTVLFLVLLSLLNHSQDLNSLNTQSVLVRKILDGLSS